MKKVSKASKVKSLKIVDGEQVVEKKEPRKFRNLAEIMNADIDSPENIGEFSRYSTKINDMNIADLERECVRVGLLPRESRGKMIELLERTWKRSHSKYADTYDIRPAKVSKEKEKTLRDILSIAR